jgi:hypothetical protein
MEEKNMMKKKIQEKKGTVSRVEEDRNEDDEAKTDRGPETEVRLTGKNRRNDSKQGGGKEGENIKLNRED